MPNLQDNITHWPSTIPGIVILVSTVIECFVMHDLDWWWQGMACAVSGCVFILAPKQAIEIILTAWRNIANNIVDLIKRKP